MIADSVSLAPVRHRWPYRDIVLDGRFLALRWRSTRLPILIHSSSLEGGRWDVSVLIEMPGEVQLKTELGDQVCRGDERMTLRFFIPYTVDRDSPLGPAQKPPTPSS